MNRIRTARLTRREFLSQSIAGALLVSQRSLFALGDATQVPFEVVPPEKSGIRWVHTAGKSPEKYLPESSGPGCAFLDYDNDGWMDIYLVNSGKCDFFTPQTPLRNALYRNNRDGTFTDVTEKAGVIGGGYGQGVAVGDYDGDGLPDIYVTQYGRSILYHNNGDGTFTDVTAKAGVAAPGWASSAVWFDYDNDGRLDLFVARFADFSKVLNKPCGIHDDGLRHYCIPKAYAPMASWLFHNNGDGTFTDVSKESGIASHLGKAWGVVATDINNDGLMDLFVSNDTVPNFLFVNRGNGKFDEIGEIAGVAYSADGLARSGMGVDSADVDQDGFMDLFVANLDHQMYSFYRNNHDETFDDNAGPEGIAAATFLMSGWGLKFFDFDNDGNLDLFLANGHPDDLIDGMHLQVKYEERPILLQWTGKGFRNISEQSGPIFDQPLSARGLAIGDFNNDGATDVLIGVNDGAPVLLRNRAGAQNHWLGIKLVGIESGCDWGEDHLPGAGLKAQPDESGRR
ncbi:MAG: FG-GAP repeat domain-containing protein [Acidobacteriaceae bacterium]